MERLEKFEDGTWQRFEHMPPRIAAQNANRRIAQSVGLNPLDLANQNGSTSSQPKPRPVTKPRAASSKVRNPPLKAIEKQLKDNAYVFPKKTPTNPKKLKIPTEADLPDIDALLAMSLDDLEKDDISSVMLVDKTTNKLVPASEIFNPDEIIHLTKEKIDTVEVWDFPKDDIEKSIEEINKVGVLSDVYVGFFLPKCLLENELMIIIREENIPAFFEAVMSKLYSFKVTRLDDGQVVRDCHPRCFCKLFYFQEKGMKHRLNPLHVAAGLNLHNFLRAVLLEPDVHFYRLDPNLKKACVEHFKAVVRRWSAQPYNRGSIIPIDMAAEEDHFESVQVFLKDPYHISYLSKPCHDPSWSKTGDSCRMHYSYEASRFRVFDTFLCKMAYHNRLHQLNQTFVYNLMRNTLRDVLYQALKDAITAGSEESIDVILNFDESLLEFKCDLLQQEKFSKRSRVGRIRNGRREYTDEEPMGAMQLLCWTKNTKRLFNAPSNAKFIKDHFGYLCLFYCLRFDDDDLRRVLNMYGPKVDKEEMFVVFQHLLFYKKFDIAKGTLRQILNTHMHFQRRKDGNDEYYGLPIHVSLPLADTLLITENALVFADVIEIYKGNMNHANQAMIYEDVSHCLQLIQHWSPSYSDQLRFALIKMLLPVALVTSIKWKKYLRMNLSEGKADPVADYVKEKYQRDIVCEKMSLLKWQDVMKEARNVVSNWNGTTEVDNDIVDLKKRNKDFMDIKPDISKLKPKELKSCLKKRN